MDEDERARQNRSDLLQSWAELERLLTSAIDRLASKLGDADRNYLMEYVENNEFGIAYEELVATVQQNSISIPADVASDLKRAASLMGFPEEPDQSSAGLSNRR